MKHIALIVALLVAPVEALSQHQHHNTDNKKAIPLIEGLGEVHHPASTKNAQAQSFFNQGLAFVYGFNHEEAIRSFTRAAELDPDMAMAHWGVALALGPNINLDIDAEREKLAYAAVQKALSLAAKGSEKERAYIAALAKRYTNDANPNFKQLSVDYKNAMGELARRYPDDLDAATLYAESIMTLRPWQLWSADGKPAEGTLEIVAVLESVLRRNPNHIGANHYYIHAVEASPRPEWALPSAQRLKVLAPSAGHLVHMPAHIDMRVGNYDAAARSNAYAALADEEHFKNHGPSAMYPMMYYSHNLHFLAVAHAMQGRFADALRASRRLEAHLLNNFKEGPMLEAMLPMFDTFMPTPTLVQIRFRKWQDILTMPAPDKRLSAASAIWRMARGMAYAATGRLDNAEAELNSFTAIVGAMPKEAAFGLSKASDVLQIAGDMLRARIAMAKGEKQAAIDLLRKAVEIEDRLSYNEPPDWYISTREALGGALLMSGNYQDAEKVFRAELEKNPRNGRALFGLSASLKGQGNEIAARLVKREFDVAWKNADTVLRIEDL